ncbi:hypothetical protein [Streptomyces mutabilis]|uniref:hypothetical protein n=2 Tax=Streptomyces mutabilis TaxID=67332 RepID=UPI0027952F2B|nr:hypothetical protein [Streptomyces mutabilis]
MLHDDPRDAVVLHHVMNGDHVRMGTPARQVPGAGAGGPQRDLAAHQLIVGEPHVHPATAERTQQQIAVGHDLARKDVTRHTAPPGRFLRRATCY